MCSLTRNLLRLNRVLKRSSLSERKEITRRFFIHVNQRLLNSDKSPEDFQNQAEVMSELKNEHNLSTDIVPPKYKVFRDEDASIIFDVDEEREKINLEEINAPYDEPDIFQGINLERGIRGVYDIEDIVDLLKRNNVMDMFVTSVPVEFAYADYVVIVTGRSPKHMKAIGEIVKRVYKKKRASTDGVPKIEGKNSRDWVAMDLGNIVLHVFSQQARKMYDLETLWSVGSKYDDQSNESLDPLTELLEKHSFLAGLQPAEVSN